jgi:hypothetical protein
MRLYVYCLCDEEGGASTVGAEGVAGARVRVEQYASVLAVVSDYAEERVPISREHLLAHNRVNACVLARTTPLPFRFGTLVTTEQLIEYVRVNESGIREALARVRGSVEMGVKIIRAAEAESIETEATGEAATRPGLKIEPAARTGIGARAEAGTIGDEAEAEGAGAPRQGSGTAYLLAKRRQVLGDERLRRSAEEIAAELASFVAGTARDSLVELNATGALVVRAAHLVGRDDVAQYRARLREFGERRPRLRLLASGPWPPYSFTGPQGRPSGLQGHPRP